MNLKSFIALLGIFVFSEATAQNVNDISIILDVANYSKYENASILVEQNGVIKISKVKEKILLIPGIPFNITIENVIPKPKPLLGLIAYRDTIISLEANLLSEVIVVFRERSVVQTLNGFEYKPYLDNDYKTKPIFNALEKLPFVIADQESIVYKDGQKILFMINGKERVGIVSWNELLRNIPAKEIYKVKMITELPPNVQLRGYKVILDINTLDANAYGHLIAPVIIADSRKNIQPNITTNWLKKRMDFSFNAGYTPDKYLMPYYAKIMKSNQIISQTFLDQNYKFRGLSFEGSIGYRLDSTTQLSLTSNTINNKTSFESISYLNKFPPNSALLQNTNNEYKVGLGYIKSKSELISSGFGISFNSTPLIQHFNNQFVNFKLDSTQYELHAPTKEYMAEYFHNNFSNEKHTLSYVLQSYYSQTAQTARQEYRTLPASDFELIHLADDSLKINQQSFSGFLQNVFKKGNKSITINLIGEYYSIETNRLNRNTFLLPGIGFQFKQLLKNNKSIRYRFSYDYLKPNLDFLISSPQFENPYETRVGNKNIIPEKNISAGIEYIIAGKFQLSHNLLYKHGYDRLRFITSYDSSLNILVSESKNNSTSSFFQYTLIASKWFSKKIRLSSQSSVSYVSIFNKNINQKNNGWAFFFTGNGTYNLPKDFGISFYIRAISNLYSDQGSKTGYFNYNMILGKRLLKNKLSIAFIAENFLLKNREIVSEYFLDENSYYTNLSRPYRLFKLRISYRLSTITLERAADKYLPTKRKEVSTEL